MRDTESETGGVSVWGTAVRDTERDWRCFCSGVFKGNGKNSYEALGRVVHDAELEALLVLEGLGQGAAQGVRRQHLLTAELELSKDALGTQQKHNTH